MDEEKQHTSKRWKLSLWITCLLVILLAGSSIFLIANSQSRAEQVTPTSIAHATGTPTTQATPTQTPTPTLTQAPTASQTPQPLFQDYFIDNSKGWLTGNAGGYTRTLDEGALTLSATNHKILIESLPASNAFDDFSLSMNFTIKQAGEHDSVGLYLRGDSNLDHDYRIDIYGNNTYSISKESLDPKDNTQVTTSLVEPTRAPQLKSLDHVNRLSVIMKGSEMVLIINNVITQSISDDNYTHGQIALFVQHNDSPQGVELLVTSLSVYPAPDELPTGTPTPGIPQAASPTSTPKSK